MVVEEDLEASFSNIIKYPRMEDYIIENLNLGKSSENIISSPGLVCFVQRRFGIHDSYFCGVSLYSTNLERGSSYYEPRPMMAQEGFQGGFQTMVHRQKIEALSGPPSYYSLGCLDYSE